MATKEQLELKIAKLELEVAALNSRITDLNNACNLYSKAIKILGNAIHFNLPKEHIIHRKLVDMVEKGEIPQ